jgi:peptidoglycan hydrolase CwlO-like protein
MKDCAVDSEVSLNRKKQGNGESIRILWWLLATVTGVLITGAFFWVTGVTTKLNTVDAAQVSSIERVTRLEEALKSLSKDISKIDQKLETTNEKLDKLLGRNMT